MMVPFTLFLGPGNYEVPKLTGAKQIISTKMNQPVYTFTSRTDKNNKVIITKDHVTEIRGRDSPGPASYKYDYNRLQRILSKSNINGVDSLAPENFSFAKEKKFFQFTQQATLKSNL